MLNIQIEKLARVMCGDEVVDSCQDCESTYNGYFTPDECNLKQMAERVIDAGYCSVSEIFTEIQAEIKAALDSNYKALPQVEMSEELWYCVRGKIDALRGIDDFIDELKKKYIGVENDG